MKRREMATVTTPFIEIWAASRAILLEWCHPGEKDLVRDQEVDEYHQHENLSCEKYKKRSWPLKEYKKTNEKHVEDLESSKSHQERHNLGDL